jgi:hypothetical protein
MLFSPAPHCYHILAVTHLVSLRFVLVSTKLFVVGSNHSREQLWQNPKMRSFQHCAPKLMKCAREAVRLVTIRKPNLGPRWGKSVVGGVGSRDRIEPSKGGGKKRTNTIDNEHNYRTSTQHIYHISLDSGSFPAAFCSYFS